MIGMQSYNLLQEIFSTISPSSESGTDREWVLIQKFVRLNADADLATLIHEAAQVSVIEPWKVGALLDHLIWNTHDNGDALLRTLESWLQGDDLLKVRYALSMQYVFPFRNELRMNEVLTSISTRWPELALRCEEIAEGRARQSREAVRLK